MVCSFEKWRFEEGVITICVFLVFAWPLNFLVTHSTRASVPSSEAYLITPKFPAAARI
jgi:hypothetical protein